MMKPWNLLKENKVFSAGFAYTIGNYLIKGITFLSLPLFSHLLSTTDYGIVNIYLAYESFTMLLIGLAIHSSIKSAFYEFKGEIDEYISAVLKVPIIMLILGIVIGNFICSIFDIGINYILINLLVIHAFSDAILLIYNNKLSLTYQYKTYLICACINTCLGLGLSILFILTIFSGQGYLGKILGAVIPITGLGVFVFISTYRRVSKDNQKRYITFALKYSIPTLPHGISQIFLAQLDRIMIHHFYGSAEAGIYSFAYNINQIILVLITSLDTVWGPWIFGKLEKKQYKEIKEYSILYIYGMFLVIAIAICISPEIIKIMAAETYWDGRYVIVPVIASTFFTFLYTIPVQVQYYLKKTKSIAGATLTAGIINIVLNAIFIPGFGYIAAAFTTLASYIVYFLIHYVLAKRNIGMYLFDSRKIVVLACGMVLWCLVIFSFIDSLGIRYGILIVFLFANGFYLLKKKSTFINLFQKSRISNEKDKMQRR